MSDGSNRKTRPSAKKPTPIKKAAPTRGTAQAADKKKSWLDTIAETVPDLADGADDDGFDLKAMMEQPMVKGLMGRMFNFDQWSANMKRTIDDQQTMMKVAGDIPADGNMVDSAGLMLQNFFVALADLCPEESKQLTAFATTLEKMRARPELFHKYLTEYYKQHKTYFAGFLKHQERLFTEQKLPKFSTKQTVPLDVCYRKLTNVNRMRRIAVELMPGQTEAAYDEMAKARAEQHKNFFFGSINTFNRLVGLIWMLPQRLQQNISKKLQALSGTATEADLTMDNVLKWGVETIGDVPLEELDQLQPKVKDLILMGGGDMINGEMVKEMTEVIDAETSGRNAEPSMELMDRSASQVFDDDMMADMLEMSSSSSSITPSSASFSSCSSLRSSSSNE